MQLQKNALDLGIVTHNGAAMLAFYRDVLGLPECGEVGLKDLGVIHKLQCGQSLIKLLILTQPPVTPGQHHSYAATTGLRYCTFTVEDLTATVARCRAQGYHIAVDIVSPRPGLSAAMVEDPDGNTIELMQLG